jgi:hypothetical protein
MRTRMVSLTPLLQPRLDGAHAAGTYTDDIFGAARASAIIKDERQGPKYEEGESLCTLV